MSGFCSVGSLKRTASRNELLNSKASTPVKTSAILTVVCENLTDETTTINAVLGELGPRSFGGILILIAGLGLLPGISVLTGVVILALGMQILVGFRSPLLPSFLAAKRLKVETVQTVLRKCITYVAFIEKWVKPRWLFLNLPLVNRLVGLIIISLGIVMMLPFPFSNSPPAIAIMILSIGQLERDGVMIVIGSVVAAISLALGVIFTGVAVHSLSQFIG